MTPRSLARSHLTSCSPPRNTQWQNERNPVLTQLSNPRSCPLITTVIISLCNLLLFFLSCFASSCSFPFLTILSISPNHCPHVCQFYLHTLPVSDCLSVYVCEAEWLSVLTWEGLTFRGRSPACSTDISARLWWRLWTEMCGGKSCLSLPPSSSFSTAPSEMYCSILLPLCTNIRTYMNRRVPKLIHSASIG